MIFCRSIHKDNIFILSEGKDGGRALIGVDEHVVILIVPQAKRQTLTRRIYQSYTQIRRCTVWGSLWFWNYDKVRSRGRQGIPSAVNLLSNLPE